MFEGDMIHGELEIGQAASQLNTILPAGGNCKSNNRLNLMKQKMIFIW